MITSGADNNDSEVLKVRFIFIFWWGRGRGLGATKKQTLNEKKNQLNLYSYHGFIVSSGVAGHFWHLFFKY